MKTLAIELLADDIIREALEQKKLKVLSLLLEVESLHDYNRLIKYLERMTKNA